MTPDEAFVDAVPAVPSTAGRFADLLPVRADMIAISARVALVQSAERLPGFAPRCPVVVRIGVEYQLVGESLGCDGI